MKEWVLKLARKEQEALGSVRCIPELRGAVAGDWIWLRGPAAPAPLDVEILRLPLAETFLTDERQHLFFPGSRTPFSKLPDLDWQPLSELFPVEVPSAALPGQLPASYRGPLVPTTEERPGEVLLTEWETWVRYAIHAPAIRLEPLQFAAAAHLQVLIWGAPLPPIPGKEYWLNHSLLLPCGFDFAEPVVAALIKQKFNPREDALLLVDTYGQWERIAVRHFVKASRSAVRLTDQELI